MPASERLLQEAENQAGRTLALGVLRGYWSLEDLDQTGGHWSLNERERRASNARRVTTSRYTAWFGPGEPYRNLAREWIATHASEFDALLQEELNKESLSQGDSHV
jgi:hypothetical protein